MCGGALGKLQNFRHKEQSLFGLLPDNGPQKPLIDFESKVENYLAPNTLHGSPKQIADAEAKSKAQSAANEAKAISEAKTLAEGADASTNAMYDAYQDGVMQNAATQSKSLLASASYKEETNKLTTTKDTKTKTTLLGG